MMFLRNFGTRFEMPTMYWFGLLDGEFMRLEQTLTIEGKTYKLMEVLLKYKYSYETIEHIAKCLSRAGNEVELRETKSDYLVYLRRLV